MLSENQFGFRSKHSTEHVLFKFVNDLQTQTIKKKLTAPSIAPYYTQKN